MVMVMVMVMIMIMIIIIFIQDNPVSVINTGIKGGPVTRVHKYGLLTKCEKLAKKERGQYPGHLDRTSLVNIGFIMSFEEIFLAGHDR